MRMASPNRLMTRMVMISHSDISILWKDRPVATKALRLWSNHGNAVEMEWTRSSGSLIP